MSLFDVLREKFGDAITDFRENQGDETLLVDRAHLIRVLTFLANNPECPFDLMLDLCGVDYLGEDPRFEVVYHLYSLKKKKRLRVKTKVSEKDPTVPSVAALWPASDWFEREAYDMFGIRFTGHPNLKRLLMWEEFVGHPLRKDYPINKRQPIPKPLDIV